MARKYPSKDPLSSTLMHIDYDLVLGHLKRLLTSARVQISFRLSEAGMYCYLLYAFQVRDNATVVLSRAPHTQQNYDQNHENHEERMYF